MILTISAVLLFGTAAAFLLRSHALGFGSGLIAFLFGFFTASTGASEPIRNVIEAIARAVADLGN